MGQASLDCRRVHLWHRFLSYDDARERYAARVRLGTLKIAQKLIPSWVPYSRGGKSFSTLSFNVDPQVIGLNVEVDRGESLKCPPASAGASGAEPFQFRQRPTNCVLSIGFTSLASALIDVARHIAAHEPLSPFLGMGSKDGVSVFGPSHAFWMQN